MTLPLLFLPKRLGRNLKAITPKMTKARTPKTMGMRLRNGEGEIASSGGRSEITGEELVGGVELEGGTKGVGSTGGVAGAWKTVELPAPSNLELTGSAA